MLFWGNEVSDSHSELYFGFWLKESEEFLLYDETKDIIKGINKSLKDVFYYEKNKNTIASIKNSRKIGDFSLLNLIELSNIQKNKNSSNVPVKPRMTNKLQKTNSLRSIQCDRGSIEKDLIHPQLSTSSTSILGFNLKSYTNFRAIDNQPCILDPINGIDVDNNGQNVFSFRLTWVIGRDGTTFGTKNHRVDKLRSEVVDESYELYIAGWNWNWFWGNQPIFKYRITGGTPKFIALDIHAFGTSPYGNHWTVGNQGDVFFINIQEFDTQICSQTNVNTQTSNIKVGGNINFGMLVKDPLIPSLSFEISNSMSHQETLVVNGTTIQDLGNTYFEYCQPYPYLDPNNINNTYFYQNNSTG